MRLIDADALKEWIENWFTKNRFYHPYAKNNNIPITELYDILEQLPSAQPERKRGKWIFVRGEEAGNALYMCSECGKGDIHATEVRVSYCWNCGAQMER